MPKNLIVKQHELPVADIDQKIEECMAGFDEAQYDGNISFEPNSIVQAEILNTTKDSVYVDIGFKSEGVIPIYEWDDVSEIEIGQKIYVMLESVEDELGCVVVSKRKADRMRTWERIVSEYKIDDTISGRVAKQIKGGLLVDVGGVYAFLPAPHVSTRKTSLSDLIGKTVECKIIRIDEERMNVVISRKLVIEAQRQKDKEKLLASVREGDVVRGVVKNITEFGAFVDLGGIDGLLHITDMSWGRVYDPNDIVSYNQSIDVMITKIDLERERISLSLRKLLPSPWDSVEDRYKVGEKYEGLVVNILPFGAFVKLEDGIEGLVHLSEFSWVMHIDHPSQVVAIGDLIDVLVLEINKPKHELSLSVKRAEEDPWADVETKYPEGSRFMGIVNNVTPYGAFIRMSDGVDGLLHVSDISWTKKVVHAEEVFKKGDSVEALVLHIDKSKRRIALGLKQLHADPWEYDIPNKYPIGREVSGKVTKITNFGIFVELEPDLEGLLHKTEVEEGGPGVGDEIGATVLRLDVTNRKIGLSTKGD